MIGLGSDKNVICSGQSFIIWKSWNLVLIACFMCISNEIQRNRKSKSEIVLNLKLFYSKNLPHEQERHNGTKITKQFLAIDSAPE